LVENNLNKEVIAVHNGILTPRLMGLGRGRNKIHLS
jgi:hypothetical protein